MDQWTRSIKLHQRRGIRLVAGWRVSCAPLAGHQLRQAAAALQSPIISTGPPERAHDEQRRRRAGRCALPLSQGPVWRRATPF